MLLPTRTNLLILGIVAQHMTVGTICTPYSVRKAHGISHVTARKELTTLKAVGLLTSKDGRTAQGFDRVQFEVSQAGFSFLYKHRELYTDTYLEHLFGKFVR